MQTVPETSPKVQKAFYAQFLGDAGYLTKVDDRLLFLAYGSSTTHVIEPADVCNLDVLGEVGTAVAAFVADMTRGGYAAIACERQMEAA